MKKKRFVGLIGVALATVMLCSVFLSGCGLFGGDNNNDDNNNNNNTPAEYTIQYTDDAGSHTLTVSDGATYALEAVPERLGYDFLGLFDAKIGGTQYVDETGQSLAPFTDKKNMVLFPQFKAREYTLLLDFQGAEVTGSRNYAVHYEETLPELPKNLSKEHSVFTGWYTEENCGGIQVADRYGLLLDKATVDATTFAIDSDTKFLYLYAGFDVETFTVTFNFGNGIPSEEVEVEYNTPISEVVPETRNSEGKAVLSWSKTSSGDQIFTGNITDNTVLYAVEWAPVIELDPNGGETITPVVAREGAAVNLPIPERDNYKFLHWETMSGEEANITKMPADGAQLKAVWQAMLVFDENGGTTVQDISQEAGTAITLPTPEKEGFIFAGWYTADKNKYETSSMPAIGIALKAGWYEVKDETIYIVSGDNEFKFDGTGEIKMREDLTIDLSDIIPNNFRGNIQISVSMLVGSTTYQIVDSDKITLYYYSEDVVSENKLLYSYSCTDITGTYERYEFDFSAELSGNILYTAVMGQEADSWTVTSKYFIRDYYVIITYPDTSNLYL